MVLRAGDIAQPAWPLVTSSLRRIIRFIRTPRGRRVANVLSVCFSLGVAALAARWFAQTGFPLLHADAGLLTAACSCFLVANGVKVFGWSSLFAAGERPRALTLFAAGGAASVAGIALPGRVDDALRVAVVRRFDNSTVGAIALSLFTLGLIDTVALTPLASTAAVSAHPLGLRVGLAVVAAAGLGAAGFFVLLPRLLSSARLVRFRLSRWVHAQWPCVRQGTHSLGYVLVSWVTRGVGFYLLIGALGVHISFALAMVFLCAGAAASALPIAPAGAVTQAGAGASVLLASGIGLSEALKVAVAAQLVTVMVSLAALVAAGAAGAARRFAPTFA